MIAGPLKYHGGKSYLAKRIIDLMPQHTHYVEPFFGGGSVLLAKDPEGISEVANDLDGDLSCFWETLRDEVAGACLIDRLKKTEFGERTWRDARHYLAGLPPHTGGCHYMRAWAFFVVCRQSLAGRRQIFAPLSRNRTRRGMNEQASAWISAVDGLPEVHARLRRVVILNRPALEVIRQQDGPETLFYCDPPYLPETRATIGEYGLNEMGERDHQELLATLAAIQGKFLLSGYPNDLYGSFEIIHGWKCHSFELPNNAAGGASKRRMTECVWTNF